MATMKRCLAQLSLRVGGTEEHFWPGLEVNMDRELKPGYTVAHAIAGREHCFEDIAPPVAAADIHAETATEASPKEQA